MKKFATLAVFSIIAAMTLSCGGDRRDGRKGKNCSKRCKTCTSLVQTSYDRVS